MSWERDPLLAKARLFFDRGFAVDREEPLFGLWCALGLELLAKSAVAAVSPVLLAEPDNEQRNLLHALNRGAPRTAPKSISAMQTLLLCRQLYEQFKEEDLKAAAALVNRRNDELHTGSAAFAEYPSSQWLPGFYRACHILAAAQGETLESIFGADEAKVATETLEEVSAEIRQRILAKIAAFRKVFEDKPASDREQRIKDAAEQGEKLAHHCHHRTKCPACASVGLLQGDVFGEGTTQLEDGEVVTRRPVAPTSFSCSACDLKLSGYLELAAAGLAGHYTRTTRESLEEHYGLIDPDGPDFGERAMEWLRENAEDGGWDND